MLKKELLQPVEHFCEGLANVRINFRYSRQGWLNLFVGLGPRNINFTLLKEGNVIVEHGELCSVAM